MKKNIIKYSLIFWSILVLVLTTFPMKEYNGTIETCYDKVAHFFLFGIFSFLLFSYLKKRIDKLKLFFVSVIFGASYSLVIEFLQVYIPGRTASELDFFAGILGSLCFGVMAMIVFKKRKDE